MDAEEIRKKIAEEYKRKALEWHENHKKHGPDLEVTLLSRAALTVQATAPLTETFTETKAEETAEELVKTMHVTEEQTTQAAEETNTALTEETKIKEQTTQVTEETPEEKPIATEADNTPQELRLVRELRKLVKEKEFERKEIFDGVLARMEREIEEGLVPQNLPTVVKNMARKQELRSETLRTASRYGDGGATYAYLWGID